MARVELGARDYVTNSYLNGKPAVALAIFQRPGTNALAAAAEIIATMEELKKDFPPGLDYQIVYNPTEFIAESMNEVYKTLFEAVVLVVLVVIVFLQSWRTAIIPIVAIPVSLIGTFAVMAALGFSLNTLTLFGLVLAIGIVVDDAIVVVENVERNIALGLTPREAAHRTMNEVGTAIIAISLVLTAVFVPTAFIPGISGQFYQQFAVTIAVSTADLRLQLADACRRRLPPPCCKPHATPRFRQCPGSGRPLAGRPLQSRLRSRQRRLRRQASAASSSGGSSCWRSMPGCSPARSTWPMRCRAASFRSSTRAMPSSSFNCRTAPRCRAPTRWCKRASKIIQDTPGVIDAVAFAGFSGATFTNASNAAAIFARFKLLSRSVCAMASPASGIIGQLFARLQSIEEAFIIAIPPPPVRGIGNAGGFKMQLQERDGAEHAARARGGAGR